MRISEIIPYVNLDRITARTFAELCDRLEREASVGAESGACARVRQYGDELHDLSVEQARLDAAKTGAEIAHLLAQAGKDRRDGATVLSPTRSRT